MVVPQRTIRIDLRHKYLGFHRIRRFEVSLQNPGFYQFIFEFSIESEFSREDSNPSGSEMSVSEKETN